MISARISPLPRAGPAREALRCKGQFWTPDWVADIMVAYALQNKPRRLLDPAFGAGVFFRVARRYAQAHRLALELFGRDIDPQVFSRAESEGVNAADLRNIEIRDFVLDPPPELFPAIIANPPYIRHHRLLPDQKARLRRFALQTTGRHIDGRAGLQVYFLLRALLQLEPDGRLAFIVSSDICEGVFAPAIWQWICSRFRLDAVIVFAPEAAPFPGVDTNALIFCLSNKAPMPEFSWITCLRRETKELVAFFSGQRPVSFKEITVQYRAVLEGVSTGLSRPPADHALPRFKLGDFASVKRGIVTGDNDFFFMTAARAAALDIPDRLLLKAVGRVRDVQGEVFDSPDIERLERQGRPTRLLYVNGISFSHLPKSVQRYLREGEKRGLPDKTLIKTRNPWYRMEIRKTPPILFAYLGRRNTRFIRNHAGVVPLTCLLCVYPNDPSPVFLEKLWRVLSHPETVANLKKVGKSYGGEAIKVEPRALERLPLPDHLVEAEGLDIYTRPKQGLLALDPA